MELCFYNAVLGGMSCDGKQFTYTNQLASSDADLSKREEWFTCACCPPNLTRLLGYLGGYLWSYKVDEAAVDIAVHMFGSATLSLPKIVELTQTSDWPWTGDIQFSLAAADHISVSVVVRIPAWASDWTVSDLTMPLRQKIDEIRSIQNPLLSKLKRGIFNYPQRG
jgi:uncharacterized protein